MTLKELEIIASSEELCDLIIYARCQLLNLQLKMNMADFRCEHNRIHHTLKSIKDEVDRVSPHYHQKCVFRR